MKTSIKSNLFFITYGIFLSFIVGLIILSNTYLESFYRKDRQESLLLAFSEVKEINLSDTSLPSLVLAIENKYNISVQILKEIPGTDDIPIVDPDLPGFSQLPLPYERIYGNQFSIRDSVLARIMAEFNGSTVNGTITSSVVNQDLYLEEGYTLYTANITSNPAQAQEDAQMLSLIAEKDEADDLNTYYILTVTIQSIQDSVGVFNSFTIIVAVGFMIVSAFIVYFASYKFTNPILQITQVTKNLANLDFSQKVDVFSNDELGILGDSINKMSFQLEKSIRELQEANSQLSKDIELKTKIDDLRKEFIASASHELKTPISLILGYSEALKLTGLDQKTTDEYLEIIIDESNKMNKLVMGLLKLSQLESGFLELSYSDFNLKNLTDETLRLFNVKFEEENIKVEVSLDNVEIHSDYDQLQTVVSNFISNAIHHVDNAKTIKVSLSEVDKNRYRFSVYNTGKQIALEDQTRIWESFYKVDKARTRSYGGQGLGLSIVKNILDELQYSYGVENQNQGVAFYFEFTNFTKEPKIN